MPLNSLMVSVNQKLKFTKHLFCIRYWIPICPKGHYFYNRNANGLRMTITTNYST